MESNPSENKPAVSPAGQRRFGWHFWALMALVGLAAAAVAVPMYLVRPRGGPPKYPCTFNLRQIDMAVQQWAYRNNIKDPSPVDQIAFLTYLKGSTLPVCPQHGTYSVTTVGATPACSVGTKGHVYELPSP